MSTNHKSRLHIPSYRDALWELAAANVAIPNEGYLPDAVVPLGGGGEADLEGDGDDSEEGEEGEEEAEEAAREGAEGGAAAEVDAVG